METIEAFDDVKILDVRVDRLEEWARRGLLCIGDAAHAMSPVGGVGINLAIQDAVATANILGPVMRQRAPKLSDLNKIQRRREWPTKVIQWFQVQVQNRILVPNFRARQDAKAAAGAEAREPLSIAQAYSGAVHRRRREAGTHFKIVGSPPSRG
ncbi:MAG: FAD-dependent monooxygenase [Rhizomicrobium sp.]